MLSRAEALALDASDPLAPFSKHFLLPQGIVYLDGNSLGALPLATSDRLVQLVRKQWGGALIGGWTTHDWLTLPRRVGDKIGRLIGADTGQVLVADSTSINLLKLLAGAVELQAPRSVILSQDGNFPTDLYIAQGLAALSGHRCRLRTVNPSEICAAIDAETAVVLLTEVDYRNGARLDMAAITACAHERGALILWDLAHSAGALPVALDACAVDLAVGCGYKYLNGGPGAPAFLYVAHALQPRLRPFLTGWLGHAEPFAFEADYRPAAGIERFLCGTPSILSLVALECGVDLLLEAPMDAIRHKSLALGDLFIDLVEGARLDFALASPREGEGRGSQVCLRHPQGYAIIQALTRRGVIGDFRSPDVLRFGFAPLYNRYTDIWDAVAALTAVMDAAEWDRPEFMRRQSVT